MIETILADNGSRFMIAAGAVAVGLLCLLAVLWIMRNRPSSPFVRGGKNRQPRLAVLDAAAVDTRRRLVLVRRDDVEHLIMIGGPTDIVIESRIVAEGAADAAQADIRPAPEPKVAETPIAAAPPEPKPLPVPPPTPARAEALEPVRQPVQPSEQVQRAEPVAPRPAVEQRPQTPVAAAPQPAPARPTPPPSAVSPVSTDVFATAHDRVLPMAQPVAAERPAPPPAAEPFRPAQPQPQPIQAQPIPIRAAAPDTADDFERMLDAEISGDLQRLTPVGAPRPESRPAPGGRQEPVLGAAPGGARPEDTRKEPTIEEEMTRMLADISAGRRP